MAQVITDVRELTPTRLTDLLHAQGRLESGAVSGVHVLKSRQTNVSWVYHLGVSYAGEASGAPARLFLKIPNPELTSDRKEIDFYTVIAPAMLDRYAAADLPFLRCYDAVFSAESNRSHLLLEELSATHFAASGPMPPTRTHCEQAMDSLARLHAYWWEHPRLTEIAGPLLTAERIAGFLRMAQGKLREFVDFAGHELTPAQQGMLERIVAAWPERRRERVLGGQGVTLVHRDPHPLNLLYPYDPGGATVKLIDWQSWRVDTGTDDLAYMMAVHWPVEERAEMEEALLRRYHGQLAACGVQGYSWADCLYDYRASVIRCLFLLVGAWSPRQWEHGTWWSRLQRGMAAFEALNCGELLAGLPAI